MTLRPAIVLLSLLALSACASPCDQIRADMRQLNANTIREPTMVLDGRYMTKFQDLAARSVEHSCLQEDGFL